MKPTVVLSSLPRMADFARWGEAVAFSMGYSAGTFLGILDSNAQRASQVALDESSLFTVLTELLDNCGLTGFVGTASELLRRLNEIATPDEKQHYAWPKSANKLTGLLTACRRICCGSASRCRNRSPRGTRPNLLVRRVINHGPHS